MKKIIYSALCLAALTTAYAFTDACDAMLFFKEGSSVTFTSYDDNDKVSGSHKTVYSKVTKTGGTVSATASAEYFDKKGKSTGKAEYIMKCSGGTIMIDMRMMMPQQQADAYKDMEMTMEGNDLEFPSTLTVGSTLKDATMKMSFKPKGSNSPMPMGMTFQVNITNRKVEAKESITTPAGTFECYKITEEVETKTMFGVKMKSVNWFSPEVGNVRTESYKENGKYMGKTELTELKK
ncbi:MAG: hypothetical protein AB1458_11695 [Bacteroidota bacterium]